MTPSEGLERRSPASTALPDVGQTISKGEPCFFRLLVVAMRCRRDGPLSLHVHAHTPRRTSVQARPVLQDLLQAFLTQQYRSHETFQSLMTRTVHRGGRTRHRCFRLFPVDLPWRPINIEGETYVALFICFFYT